MTEHDVHRDAYVWEQRAKMLLQHVAMTAGRDIANGFEDGTGWVDEALVGQPSLPASLPLLGAGVSGIVAYLRMRYEQMEPSPRRAWYRILADMFERGEHLRRPLVVPSVEPADRDPGVLKAIDAAVSALAARAPEGEV